MVSALVVAALSFGLAGCSIVESWTPEGVKQREALDAYVAAKQTDIPRLLAAQPDVYSAITIKAEAPSTVVFTYHYAIDIDAVATAKTFDDNAYLLQDELDRSVDAITKKYGFTKDLHVRYIYVSLDRSTIWEREFTPTK